MISLAFYFAYRYSNSKVISCPQKTKSTDLICDTTHGCQSSPSPRPWIENPYDNHLTLCCEGSAGSFLDLSDNDIYNVPLFYHLGIIHSPKRVFNLHY